MLLAAAGADVTVLEKGGRVGGRSRALRADGYRFDTGPTFFLYPRIIAEIFATCGFDFHREVEMVRLDPLYRLAFLRDDGTPEASLPVPADPARLAAAIAAFSPADAANLHRFMADNRTKLTAFAPVLAEPFNGLADLLRPKVLAALRHLRPWASVDQDLARWFQDPRLRLAFSFQSKYLGMSPYRCPSLFTILSFLEHEHGVWHPLGGCNAVMERMAELARDLGARIHLGTPVRELLFHGRRAVGVRTDAGIIPADAVVVNADFAQAMTTLVPDRLRRRWRDRTIAAKRYSCSTFMLYLGVEGRIDLDHHTIALAENYTANLAAIESGREPPAAPSLYIQNASVSDPSLAPPGHSALYVLVPVGNLAGGIDWTAWQTRFRAEVLRRLAALGLGNLERRIRVERMMTPKAWADDLSVFRGATFNLAHSLDQMLCWRPRNRFEDLERVYLVGGGTHPGSGLPVIFEGARITSRLIANDLALAATAAPVPRPDTPRPAPLEFRA